MQPSSTFVPLWITLLLVLPGSPSALAGDWLDEALSRSERPEADRVRDADRMPAEVLRFCGLEPGMTVADLMAGSGYYTGILSPALGETLPVGMMLVGVGGSDRRLLAAARGVEEVLLEATGGDGSAEAPPAKRQRP